MNTFVALPPSPDRITAELPLVLTEQVINMQPGDIRAVEHVSARERLRFARVYRRAMHCTKARLFKVPPALVTILLGQEG